MSPFRKIAFLAFLLTLFFAVPAASAHRPEEGAEGRLTRIPDPTTSFAYYREMGSGDYFHLYAVEGTAGQDFHAGINIPQLEGLESYGVTLALFGPGLPEVDTARLPAVMTSDSASPDLADMGGVVVESRVTEDFYEPFTQTDYWGRQSLDIPFPENGTYYLAVWQPQEEGGKYVLDTGRREVFSAADLFRFPVWWWETRAYFGQLPSPWAAAVAGLVLLGGGVLLLRRRAAVLQES